MQNSPKLSATSQHVDVLLFDHFSNHCLANTVEPLRAANTLSQRDLYVWRFYTLDGLPVTSSSGMQVAPHGALVQACGDTLVVMPSYGVRALDRGDVMRPLRQAAGRYRTLIGMDTGSWLLARAGVLDGHSATIHWDVLDSFAETFAEVEVERARYVIDGARITCSGAMAAFDLVVHLIGQAHGPLLAMEVAQLFMTHDVSPHAPGVPRRSGRTVTRAIAQMQAHLESPLSIAALARRVGCTQKTLEVRVRAAMHITPQALYRRLRLNHALGLVRDTDHSVSEIAGRCGYENPSAMTRAFRATFDQSPSEMRKRADVQ